MITYDVQLCIGSNSNDDPVVVKCHDTGVNLRTSLVTCKHNKWRTINEAYTIPPGSTAVLKIAKPDKTFVLADGYIGGGYIFFPLPPQSFTVAGVSSAEVSLFGDDGRRITTATFHIDVPNECVCDCDMESKTYVDIMAEYIIATRDAAASAEAASRIVRRRSACC